MFKCDVCKQSPKPAQGPRGEEISPKPTRIVVERRSMLHPMRKRDKEIIDLGGSGTQIVREVSVCAACAPLVQTA